MGLRWGVVSNGKTASRRPSFVLTLWMIRRRRLSLANLTRQRCGRVWTRPRPRSVGISVQHCRLQEIREADAMQHLRPETVEHREADIGAVFGRVVVDAEGTLAEGMSTTSTIASATPGTRRRRARSPRRPSPPPRRSPCRDQLHIRPSAPRRPGDPEWAKWLVPLVNAPGTTIEVSMPQRASSRAYSTASASIAALAAK